MSNKVLTIEAITDRNTKVGITIFTSDYGFEIKVDQNCVRTFEGNIIIGTGIKKIQRIHVTENFSQIDIFK